MEIFINKAITNGINSYIKQKNNLPYNLGYYFELTIIEILVKIYGEFNIINPYKIKYDKIFINNLKVYGIESEELLEFFNALEEYETWLRSSTGKKTNSINTINKTLTKMILLKNLHTKIENEEVQFYDNYLGAKDLKFKQILELSSNDYRESVKFWNKKKNIYLTNNQYILEKIEPNLLTNTMYEKHGLNIEQIKRLSNLKVNEVNNLIAENENRIKHAKRPFKLVLTSGSGIIDTIVLFSIVLTEIFIGFLIAILGR